MQGAEFAPLGTIHGPVGGMAKRRAESFCSQVLSGRLHMAGSTVDVELAATRKVNGFSVVVSGKRIVIRYFDVDGVSARLGGYVGQRVGNCTFLVSQGLLAIGLTTLVDRQRQGNHFLALRGVLVKQEP